MMKSLFVISAAITSVYADVYMHNPRGSNDRNCRTDNDQNRRNGNRLFDSQNNAKGGYSCPLARPFDCYKILDDALRTQCNQKNAVNPTAAMVNDKGVLHPEGTVTPRMYYYEGSILPIEWTSQHGCGGNSRVRCDIVIQYACEDTLTDVCDSNQGVASPGAKCGPRDGFPVTNSLNTGNLQRDAEATATIPDNNNNEEQSDYRYGRHETLTYYRKCNKRERNKGLFAADQNINGNTARFTRQNNNGNRNGLECPEESEYWPYWHDSPWKDVAVLTSDVSQCSKYISESQNVKSKNECDCPNCAGDVPNNERGCIQQGGTWVIIPAHGIPAPECVKGPAQRENHLGMSINDNVAGMSSHYNWTLPTLPAGAQTETCILRLRYNISTIDANMVSVVGDAKDNGFFSPLKDRTNNEPKAYKGFSDILDETLQTHAKLGLAVNTNQYGRVFQDRSYTFSIRKAPVSGDCANKRIYNVNVRGKRGNIVQTYPAVEYDFVPNHLELTTGDCIHLQWTGSDYNPDQNPNNGYGGPSSPLNLNEAKADRHNLVQVPKDGMNAPVTSFEEFNMFAIDLERKMNLAFIGQPIDNPLVCKNITEIKEQFPNLNQDARDRLHFNCGKLSGAPLPYFDGGLVRPASIGTFYYMSTRDNSFTNRDMKGTIVVNAGLSTAESIGTGVAVGVAVLGAAVLGAFMFRKRSSSGNGTRPASTEKKTAGAASMISKTNDTEKALPPPKEKKAAAIPVAAAAPIAAAKAKPEPKMTCTALHAHEASEPGELSFNKGDKITIIKKDPSGWWEGTNGKARGIFPANYVKED